MASFIKTPLILQIIFFERKFIKISVNPFNQ
jgi:hypothetical protein